MAQDPTIVAKPGSEPKRVVSEVRALLSALDLYPIDPKFPTSPMQAEWLLVTGSVLLSHGFPISSVNLTLFLIR